MTPDHAESNLMVLIVELWKEYNSLEVLHPDDTFDFRKAIHDMQRIIICRDFHRRNKMKSDDTN
jgi:hypothetical protein